MVWAWKLLLTLAVLGTLASLGDCACSSDGECYAVCGYCDTFSGRNNCMPIRCGIGEICNSASGKCVTHCTNNTDCRGAGFETKCNTCDPNNGFCQPCPAGTICNGANCVCDDTACGWKCGKNKIPCCSTNGTSCNCCLKDSQTCLTVTDKQAKSFSWSHSTLRMERALILSQTCQNLCTKESEPKDNASPCDKTNCEKCHPNAPEDPKTKVCMPCSFTKKCDPGENACCTEKGCVCCDAGQDCTYEGCKCLEEICYSVCRSTCVDNKCPESCGSAGYSCDLASNSCSVPSSKTTSMLYSRIPCCNETTCNNEQCGSCDIGELGYFCYPDKKCAPHGLSCSRDDGRTCECTPAYCSSMCEGTCASNGTGLCIAGACPSGQACKANSAVMYSGFSCQCDEDQCDAQLAAIEACDLDVEDSCCGSRGCDCYPDSSLECPPSKEKRNRTGIIPLRSHKKRRDAASR